ncbi:RNA 2',3'-cyclic phosphodiesterase [Shigella flexneri]
MSEPKRLFFAIELPGAIREPIVHWRAEQFPPEAGRPVAAENLHLTLAFLGDVSAEKQQALSQLAGRIRQPGFTLKLDDAGQWLRSRSCGWGCVSHRAAYYNWRICCGAGRPQRVLSKPRVSPTHHAAARCRRGGSHPPPGFGWSFPVTEFALYSSSFARGRTRYTQLQRWTLTK